MTNYFSEFTYGTPLLNYVGNQTVEATATATLGQLTALVEATPEVQITATAQLGSLTASATRPEPPAPSPGGGIPNYRRKKPQFVDLVEEPIVIEKPINQIFASSANIFDSFSAEAESNIQWSILEDEADLLLIL